MLALYIILGVILLVILILHFPVVASIDLKKEQFDLKVKFMFFSIYPLKEKKPKKNSKTKRKKRKKISSKKRKKLEKELAKEKQAYKKSLEKAKLSKKEETTTDKSHEQEDKKPKENKKTNKNKDDKKKLKDKFNKYKEKWEKIKPYVPLGKKVVKKLLKAIKIRQLFVYLVVSDEDAYECAMKYGKISAGVYNALALMKNFFTVSIKHIAVDCKFNSNENDYNLSCKIKVLPSTIILIALFTLASYIHTNVKLRHNKK